MSPQDGNNWYVLNNPSSHHVNTNLLVSTVSLPLEVDSPLLSIRLWQMHELKLTLLPFFKLPALASQLMDNNFEPSSLLV